MKKIIAGLCLASATLLMGISASAMKPVKVPMKVRSVFHHEYKNATAVKWTMRNGDYDASFRENGSGDMEARYDWTGHRLDTRVPVAQSSMPAKAVGHLEKKYGGSYSHTYTKIERPWKKSLYMVKVEEKGKSVAVYVDKNGHEHEYASR